MTHRARGSEEVAAWQQASAALQDLVRRWMTVTRGTRERSSRWPWADDHDVPVAHRCAGHTNAFHWRARFRNVHLARLVELDLPSRTRNGTDRCLTKENGSSWILEPA